MNFGEGLRVALDGFEAPVECLQKLVTKVVTSLPVPLENVADVGLGGLSEPEIHFLRFSSSRTCDQDRVALGSCW